MLGTIEPMIHLAGQMLVAEASRAGGPRGRGSKAPIDVEVEDFLVERLRAAFPGDEILAEENGGLPGSSGRSFILDPHDGTSDFLRGRRETSVCLALVEDGQIKMGVVYAPFATELTGEKGMMLSWEEGGPMSLNGQPIAPLPCRGELSDQSVVLISANVRGQRLEDNRRRLAPARVMPCSSVATRFALVACGAADAAFTIRNPLEPWDFAAAQALIRAAGGELVGPSGAPLGWSGTRPERTYLEGYFVARSQGLAAKVAATFSDITGFQR